MTDWTKSTGSSGTMMIRDTGTTVEFWLKAGSSTYAYNMPWGYTINGGTNNSQTFRFESGGAWQRLGSWNITYNQTVNFHIGSTGTSGLGGPTDFSHAISRATAPSPPYPPNLTVNSDTIITATFSDGPDGGSPINIRLIEYGTDPNAPQSQNAPGPIGGLTPGTTYYFWAITHNAVGWSSRSGRSQATTLRVPDAPSSPVMSDITQLTMIANYSPNGDGGASISSYEVCYGTDPVTPQVVVTASPGTTISNLLPGTTYYFWARVGNSVGWSPWSARSTARTIAGARIKVGSVWKEAVPYVRDGGVWKVARPWGRVAGVWKESR